MKIYRVMKDGVEFATCHGKRRLYEYFNTIDKELSKKDTLDWRVGFVIKEKRGALWEGKESCGKITPNYSLSQWRGLTTSYVKILNVFRFPNEYTGKKPWE